MSVLHVPQDSQQLATELVEMVNNPAFSDIQFLCKDGVKVHASRVLLAARSTMLKKMLTNGMLETSLTEIPLPTISSSALVPTFEFMHTGGIKQRQFNFEIGLEVLHAAEYFMLDALKQQMVSLLTKAVKEVTSKPALVSYMSIAAELGCCDEFVHHIAVSLEKADTSWSFVKDMSLHTMQVYFRVSKVMNEEPALCLMEYLRLRQILLWCSLQVSSEAETKMTLALPTEELFSKHFHSLKTSNKSYGVLVDPQFLYSDLNGIVARIVELKIDWSQVVRLQSIHPVLLYTVIKPLGVIPSDLFEATLRYQGCHLGDLSVVNWVVNGKENTNYETLGNGAGLRALHGRLPPVRVNMSIFKRHGIYEFEVHIVETAPGMVIGIGSVPGQGRNFAAENLIASVHSSSHADHFRKNSRIRVIVDMGVGACHFCSGNESIGKSKFDSREVVVFTRFGSPGIVRIALQTPAHLI